MSRAMQLKEKGISLVGNRQSNLELLYQTTMEGDSKLNRSQSYTSFSVSLLSLSSNIPRSHSFDNIKEAKESEKEEKDSDPNLPIGIPSQQYSSPVTSPREYHSPRVSEEITETSDSETRRVRLGSSDIDTTLDFSNTELTKKIKREKSEGNFESNSQSHKDISGSSSEIFTVFQQHPLYNEKLSDPQDLNQETQKIHQQVGSEKLVNLSMPEIGQVILSEIPEDKANSDKSEELFEKKKTLVFDDSHPSQISKEEKEKASERVLEPLTSATSAATSFNTGDLSSNNLSNSLSTEGKKSKKFSGELKQVSRSIDHLSHSFSLLPQSVNNLSHTFSLIPNSEHSSEISNSLLHLSNSIEHLAQSVTLLSETFNKVSLSLLNSSQKSNPQTENAAQQEEEKKLK